MLPRGYRHIDAHSVRVSRYGTALGRRLGLGNRDLAVLTVAGLLHDIGKGIVPGPILRKPGPLTSGELVVVQQHAEAGSIMLADWRHPHVAEIADVVRHHHERLDGSGYPDHLHGSGISLAAQVIAVADVWDALTSHRPYRPAMTPAQAAELMQREARSGRLNPDLVACLVQLASDVDLSPPTPSLRYHLRTEPEQRCC